MFQLRERERIHNGHLTKTSFLITCLDVKTMAWEVGGKGQFVSTNQSLWLYFYLFYFFFHSTTKCSLIWFITDRWLLFFLSFICAYLFRLRTSGHTWEERLRERPSFPLFNFAKKGLEHYRKAAVHIYFYHLTSFQSP